MKTFLLSVVMLAGAWSAAIANELVRFDLNTYNGWDYTRPGFVLNSTSIGQNDVTLYKASNGDNYTLISPIIDKGTVTSLKIKVLGYSKLYNNPNYDAYKGSPTIEIIDGQGNVLKSVFYEFKDKVLIRDFTVHMSVADLHIPSFKVRLACWSAGIYSALAIREVVVDDGIMRGDVNGDGEVTSADVTALYDYMLNNDSSSLVHGDQNGDGQITSSDITAVYSVLLGT